MFAVGLLVVGLVALTIGAEVLVRGASGIAAAARVSPLVIGLTVVAFGTSAPELVVCLQSCFTGQPDLAVGNAVGSNIFNVLFILGISAVIVPLVVAQQLIWFDVPLMVLASAVTGALAWDGRLGRGDGILLFSGLLAYTGWAIIRSRREEQAIRDEYAAEFGEPAPTAQAKLPLNLGLTVAGLGLLALGSRWFTGGAADVARWFGVSELVIGLTVVAVGTSLPEVATSIMAAVRGERDIAVGNVVGSNMFNLLAVLGLTATVAPEGIAVSPQAIALDIPVMIVVAAACLPIFFTGHAIERWEGALFLGGYAAYTTYLVLAAKNSSALADYRYAMLTFAAPLAGIAVLASVGLALRKGAPREA
ncbi:MAG: calcium/sodium antiporter [Pirellulales bacterium]|nr:calcium/sodium antiporter [Pirellulales bacterium]